MRTDRTRRRQSLLGDLFAERQVYLRSGLNSRYVVVSRPLQIGVAIGLIVFLTWLALASFGSVSKHFEVVAQRRALADLETVRAEADTAARALAELRRRSRTAEAEVERLSAALARAEADRRSAETAATEAGAKLAELRAALDQTQAAHGAARADAEARIRELDAALAAASSESRDLATRLQEIRSWGEVETATLSTRMQAALAEVTGLRAALERANRQAEAARRAAARAQDALRRLRAERGTVPPDDPIGGTADGSGDGGPARLDIAAAPAAAVVQLEEELAGAQATIAALSADLAAVKGGSPADASGPGGAGTELALVRQQLAAANRRVDQLGAALARAQSRGVTMEFGLINLVPLPSPPAPR